MQRHAHLGKQCISLPCLVRQSSGWMSSYGLATFRLRIAWTCANQLSTTPGATAVPQPLAGKRLQTSVVIGHVGKQKRGSGAMEPVTAALFTPVANLRGS